MYIITLDLYIYSVHYHYAPPHLKLRIYMIVILVKIIFGNTLYSLSYNSHTNVKLTDMI